MMEQSNISEFFENKSVLVTGMTGFIGRAVVIKLLRSCPGIIHIYVLIRANRGKSAHERLADILVTEVRQTISFFDLSCPFLMVSAEYFSPLHCSKSNVQMCYKR